jgi:integration host factor subunit beta
MIRKELIASIALDGDLSPADAARVVDCFFSSITDHLAEHGRVELRGFGAFDVRAYPVRRLRNPRTGEPMTVTASTLPKFRMSKGLLGRLG